MPSIKNKFKTATLFLAYKNYGTQKHHFLPAGNIITPCPDHLFRQRFRFPLRTTLDSIKNMKFQVLAPKSIYVNKYR